jgi:TRAP-type C4-dicarboxylate transport system permease small subunit
MSSESLSIFHRLWRTYSNLVKILEKVASIMLIVVLTTSVVLIAMQVFLRYVVAHPFSWTEEIARFLYIWSVFLGASLALRKYELIAVDFFVQRLSEPARKSLQVISSLLSIFFITILTRYGILLLNIAKTTKTISSGAQIPMYFVYILFPISGVMMLIFSVTCLIETLIIRKN